MSDSSGQANRRALAAALDRIFRALARLCLRHGLSYEATAEIAKRAFVDTARREFRIPGRKQSASRIALLTGLHRKDVGRMMKAEQPADPVAEARVAYAARVIGGWRRDETFADPRGGPAALPFEGGASSFVDLVKRHGGRDVPGRAVLDELTRVGAVSRLRDGRIKLVARAYVPAAASVESLAILGSDVADLIAAIDHNLSSGPDAGFFQRRVSYDDIPAEAVDELHARVRREGHSLLERLDRVFARHDRDSNPKSQGTGRKRVMTGVYFFVEDVEPDEEKKP
ncbi:MAG: hypothetical protein FJ144_09630 [Deltaproteobacteria bacterium]|nr:hypothetical protein [Deltaproteobacteria bacterium]